MRNRSDFMKRLHEADRFKQALAAARTDAERDAIKSLVEGFVGGFADVLAPMIARAEQDPEFARQLGRALVEGKDVLSNSAPVTSGSAG
jgi:hypothetical protein